MPKFGPTYSLAQRSALANGNLITLLDTESGGNVGGEVLVALLITRVLGDKVEVLSSDNEGSVHLGGNDGAGQDTTTDGNEASEGALLVYAGVSNPIICSNNYSPSIFPQNPPLCRLIGCD